MIRKLLATTALTAFAATGAYAQAANEITVQPGDTVVIEAEREDAQINLRFQSGDLAGAPQDGAQQQTGAAQDGVQQDDAQQQAETGQAQDQQMAQDGQAAETETLDRGQFEATDLQQISADELIGSDVYSAQDENIGNVGDVLLTEDGQVDAIVVDVGGFLGMGANEVALGMDDLELMSDAQGNLYVYSPYTQEQLEGSPQYDQATWTEQRDEQRVTGEMAAQQQPAQQDGAAAMARWLLIRPAKPACMARTSSPMAARSSFTPPSRTSSSASKSVMPVRTVRRLAQPRTARWTSRLPSMASRLRRESIRPRPLPLAAIRWKQSTCSRCAPTT
jgi:hypothetical protein